MSTAFALTTTHLGFIALIIFFVSYALVMTEEMMHLPKCKPVLLGASLIWLLCAVIAKQQHQTAAVTTVLEHGLAEYGQLLLFLIVAMAYVNALTEQGIFKAIQAWLMQKNLSYRQLFWATGFLAFFISPVADNLTTALVVSSIIIALGKDQPKFITLSCINIVIAANAGGAFSPFGDITTLMVWQKGIIPFAGFIRLLVPSLVSFLIPAFFLSRQLPNSQPTALKTEAKLGWSAWITLLLFLLTLTFTMLFKSLLHLPAAVGMMFGFSLLLWQGYCADLLTGQRNQHTQQMLRLLTYLEWDTLLFFYGVMLSVAGLACLGYLAIVSHFLYHQLGTHFAVAWQATPANVILGLLSAVFDNIPLMYTILTMHPVMSEGQWLLVTLTSGIGGSLLSIGSAAGVAVMGQVSQYNFANHFRQSWWIFLGFSAAVVTHIFLNIQLF